MSKPIALVGVCGGIAAYKSAVLCSLLGKNGYDVQVLMTDHATKFVQPLTFQALTKHPVVVDIFAEPNPSEIAHIAIADRADIYVIAPATANVIAKLALGLADDMVTTTALATMAPILVAPAMNVHMFQHPIVQSNIARLREFGMIVLEPGEGPLACGYIGKGRMPEPEDILSVMDAIIQQKKDMVGIRLLVSAGPTVEDIDPVRYLSNASSGKMGYAIAEAAVMRGANVTLVTGPSQLPSVTGAKMAFVRSTDDMLRAITEEAPLADIFISAAAPADFRPRKRMTTKWKKSSGTPVLELESTPDILAAVSKNKSDKQLFVGFAAETENVVEYGLDKLVRKGLDMVVANNVSEPEAGFAVDTNRVIFLYPDEEPETLPLLRKDEVAQELLTRVVELQKMKRMAEEG